jgi:hypothetical protein
VNSHQRERHPYPWYQARPPYPAPSEQTAERGASVRAWETLMLSPNPETWGQLLKGNEVPMDTLDLAHWQRLRANRLL